MEDEISSLYYILNQCIDISTFPKAQGVLRQTQILGTEVLRLFDEICKKNNITYWLDHGTLLGAVRHCGFIPWDDDLDVAVPRDEYNQLYDILCNELADTEIEIINKQEKRMALTIWKAGINLDIYPIDAVSKSVIKNHSDLKTRILKYRKYYNKHYSKSNQKKLISKKSKTIGAYTKDNAIWYHNPEFDADGSVFEDSTIFPLKAMQFENYEFTVPNKYDVYLRECYGEYMGFPHGGILHHKGGNGRKMYKNSEKYLLDMNELIEKYRKLHIHY